MYKTEKNKCFILLKPIAHTKSIKVTKDQMNSIIFNYILQIKEDF